MKVVVQRVSEASVTLGGKLYSSIREGMLILVGIQADDTEEDIEWLSSKICNLRIFDDEKGIMNYSIKEKGGDILAVSQFTLMARVKKGNRPSYIDAARPEISIPLYEKFVQALAKEMQKEIKTGVFGADMQVRLNNNGPVTILMDSKKRI
ncbi:D-aminoacyl-tRNA deacylase [uncultured Odoribacter sp.]|mgnify:CR=1 FL=1|uniref:D-aminoacyl-tRNA deacylase n=1 Tax=uncultured Odoribacter sp. TaxID=876416 RepID=UPI002617DF47|nr:D-aminoacyl-tRNA deacylase [uncultured Odoribacter sp.]